MTPASGSRNPRVWRACERCRKRKIKCDGRDPCGTCAVRYLPCTFPAANDNAASNRQYMPALEARFRRVDALCEKAEALLQRLSGVADALHQGTGAIPLDMSPPRLNTGLVDLPESPHPCDAAMSMSDYTDDTEGGSVDSSAPLSSPGHLAMDSYGRFRYVGGGPNTILVDSVRAMTGMIGGPQCSTLSPESQPMSSSMHDQYTTASLPFFTPGTWPSIPYIPRPDQIPRPPRYIVDPLLSIFFEQMHYTFPILYRPRFMSQYHALIRDGSTERADAGFLSVFFAVCAFASSLMDHGSGQRHPGIEYYQKAVVVHNADTGQASIEQVQCLALLSLCCARWNTLTQSWKFSGQAVRAAQDIGLHVDMYSPEDGISEVVARERNRRVWWAVVTIDCVVSVSLGRPMMGFDPGNTCPFPRDLGDEALEALTGDITADDRDVFSGGPPLTGFIHVARLCTILGGINRLSQKGKHLQQNRPSTKSRLFHRRQRLEEELKEWTKNLPASLTFSLQKLREDMSIPAHRTMRVALSVMHSTAVMHLQGLSMPSLQNPSTMDFSSHTSHARQQLMQAAVDCMQATQFFQGSVPPSHYLTFCVHQVTLSGMILLRLSPQSTTASPDMIEMVTSCILNLSALEAAWLPAQHNRFILQGLLNCYLGDMKDRPLQRDAANGQDKAGAFSLASPSLWSLEAASNIESFLLNEIGIPGTE